MPTEIQWTDETWNPIRGCSRVSEGCGSSAGGGCYAERQAHRFSGPGGPYEGLTRMTAHGPRWTGTVRLVPEQLDQPLRWKKPRRIFVNSMSDLFHESLSDEAIAEVWQRMGAAPWHVYQVLTKRADRMRSWVSRWHAGEIAEPYLVADVPGFPGYAVTTHGTVLGKRSDTVDGLAQEPGEQGHRRVTMHRSGSPKSGERALVHRLVLTAFSRPPRPGEQACHRNGDPSDNRLSNLYWGTHEDNWGDRLKHGHGRSHAKLSAEDVGAIRERLKGGEAAYSIAKDYPVSDTQIRNIARGAQWATPSPVARAVAPARELLDCVWLGVSVEHQEAADARIPLLLQTPAAVRFLSIEPLLGPIEFSDVTRRADAVSQLGKKALAGIDWVIVGGESGPKARPMDVAWARAIVEQCRAAGVACFVKQLGTVPMMDESEWRALPTTPLLNHCNDKRVPSGFIPLKLAERKGGDLDNWPADLRVREMPR